MAQQDYIKALEVCDKALEVARENNAGFEAIGKVKICEILVFLSSLNFGPSSLSLRLIHARESVCLSCSVTRKPLTLMMRDFWISAILRQSS